MKKSILHYFVVMTVVMLVLFPTISMAENDNMQSPSAENVPGLMMEDKFPKGCVDCHINMPDAKQDMRLSTMISRWTKSVGEKLLKKAQEVSPNIKLQGVHPPIPDSFMDIPHSCTECHTKTSETAPPFTALIHAIHISKKDGNLFMTVYKGECTHCHKINFKTGAWAMPSGPEK